MADDTKKLQLIIEAHNRSTTELNKLLGSIQEVRRQTQQTTAPLTDAQRATREWAQNLSLASQGARSARGEIDGLVSKIAAGGLVGSLLGQASSFLMSLPGVFRDVAAAVGGIGTEASKVGLGAEEFQRLQAAARKLDTDSGTLFQSMKQLQRSIAEATINGASPAAQAFDLFGIKIRDSEGNARSAREVIVELADAFRGGEASGEKLALLFDLLGRNAEQMVPFLSAGGQEIARMMSTAVVYSDEVIGRLDQIDKRAKEMTSTFERFKTYALVGLFEVLSGDMGKTAEQAKKLTDAFKEFEPKDKGNDRAKSIQQRIEELRLAAEQKKKEEEVAKSIDEANEAAARARASMRRYHEEMESKQAREELEAQNRLMREQQALAERFAAYRVSVIRAAQESELRAAEEAASRMQSLQERFAEYKSRTLDAQREREIEASQKAYDESLQGGLDRYVEYVRSRFQTLGAIGEQVAHGIGNTFSTFFFDVAEQRFDSLNEAMRSLAQNAFRMLAGIGSQVIGQSIGASLASSVPAAGAAQGGYFAGGLGPVKAFATGGIVKAHNPLIGIIGEGDNDELVLPVKNGMADLSRVRESGGGSLTVNVNMNVQTLDAASFGDLVLGRGKRAIGAAVAAAIYENPAVASALARR